MINTNNVYKRPCLFLDRDGIINTDIAYAYKPEQIEFVDGIFSLCRFMQRHGFLIIVVTNQSGIARNYYSEAQFQELSEWMKNEFLKRGITINDIKHCPHHPKITGPCSCRKPEPGMLLEAIEQYAIDPELSVMIGDKASDMQAGMRAGILSNVWISKDHVQYSKSQTDTVNSRCLRLHRLNELRPLLGL